MIHHDTIPAFEVNKMPFESGLECIELCHKLKNEVDKAKNIKTIAHYTSPQAGIVSISKVGVAELMQTYGMDVIQVCGDELAEIQGIEEDLGLILEHQADSKSGEFDELLDEMKLCLHQLGWSYDGWLAEEYEVFDGEVGNVSVH